MKQQRINETRNLSWSLLFRRNIMYFRLEGESEKNNKLCMSFLF